ncbi:MAG: TIGR04282 family arsenosugar biosynthesis glycosyltransferase, partial [Burkholderiales bacterium]|nr:TIGR04282 family arsenosugar biosynthesis glycosyltransferase [Burkholderiales bacterium]
GRQGAGRRQRRLTRRALGIALDAGLGAVTLWCTPDARHRFFRALQRTSGVPCLVQSAGDLGQRMHTAFRLHCAQGPLLLIGTDCPPLTAPHLRRAALALLQGADAVFHPALDGGYVLVGLRRPQPELFLGMAWSTAAVMADTRARARRAGLRVRELETLWDLDVPADRVRWRAAAAAGPGAAGAQADDIRPADDALAFRPAATAAAASAPAPSPSGGCAWRARSP